MDLKVIIFKSIIVGVLATSLAGCARTGVKFVDGVTGATNWDKSTDQQQAGGKQAEHPEQSDFEEQETP